MLSRTSRMKDLSQHEINTDPIYCLIMFLNNSSLLSQGKWCRRIADIFNHLWNRDTLHNGWSLILLADASDYGGKKGCELCLTNGFVECSWNQQSKACDEGMFILDSNVLPPTFSLHFHSAQREMFSRPMVITHTINDTFVGIWNHMLVTFHFINKTEERNWSFFALWHYHDNFLLLSNVFKSVK